ncbi:hypothetical protein THMIRHAT_20610 [Thiosulfativibrio zosterae]|uniref:Polysaccharide biosynthesis protein C-terminal domain-containing protein n=2 Tax=Thiosulfativibrio zosterae TaxID=2675053 RepID=A0A6F8PQC7_9GAMM|nr:hypothetical protein THMIRHAT_20610 [Thiosulfativibrio zosterae]
MLLIVTTIKTLNPYSGWHLNKNEIKSLFVFGGWVSISNIISPLMVYFDRFYIGAVLSVAVVAFYTTPFDLLTKALIIPFALVGVMFATFATDWQSHQDKVIHQFKISILIISAFMLPFSVATFIFAEEGLTLWIGSEFASQSYLLVKWLSVGIFINAIAMIPFAFIQAIGKADITAKLHLIELPIYAALLWTLVENFGLIGAPMAWVIRVSIDTLILMILSLYLMNKFPIKFLNQDSLIESK